MNGSGLRGTDGAGRLIFEWKSSPLTFLADKSRVCDSEPEGLGRR